MVSFCTYPLCIQLICREPGLHNPFIAVGNLMNALMSAKFILGLVVMIIYGISGDRSAVLGQLSPDFYRFSCPNVDQIVFETLRTLSARSNVVAPSILRLFFHDCFIQGCDASIMISSTPFNRAERDLAENNIGQTAFDTISEIKKEVERACPGVVSCADIIALAAKDAVALLGGPNWQVPKGRLDGLTSQAATSVGRIPGGNVNSRQLINSFSALGFSVVEMVVLSGAHTVGFSQCREFSNRLYNFSPVMRTDPSMEPGFVRTLEASCPLMGDPSKFQAIDISTPFVFDNTYFKNLVAGRGLLFSDQDLFSGDNETRDIVMRLANSQELFFSNFAAAMIKLGSLGVRTDRSNGEIRQDCTAFNSH